MKICHLSNENIFSEKKIFSERKYVIYGMKIFLANENMSFIKMKICHLSNENIFSE